MLSRLSFNLPTFVTMNTKADIFLPPEWHPQSGVMLTWPHMNTDWINLIDEVEVCFTLIANEILKSEKLLIVAHDAVRVSERVDKSLSENLIIKVLDSNDTWARDHGGITIFRNGKPEILDFQFNGWGMKFPAHLDNQLTKQLFIQDTFRLGVTYHNCLNFVLEGGSLEVDGDGTLLTTEACLLSINRNQTLTKKEIEEYLIKTLGVNRVLWLSAGYLIGDDTDSHVDTLARFCNENTIAYVKCEDPADVHFEQLSLMETELKSFLTAKGVPYQLVPLPMASPVYDEEGKRLPATYANFLIINNKILMPTYGTRLDRIAMERISDIFPDREVVGIDCSVLIKQHGSLHCVTMQFPEGVL